MFLKFMTFLYNKVNKMKVGKGGGEGCDIEI